LNPIKAAECSVTRGINIKPTFAWWVDHTLKKRDRVISAAKKRVVKNTHKFGMQVPTNVDEARALDKTNGNNFWTDVIAKEMKNVRVAFDVLEGNKRVGHQET
jgi:hypothetical protein